MIKRPNSRVNLDKAIERIFGKYEKSIEIRSIMANTIVGHMLPDAVVKGGSSLKLRYGNSRTRVTMDLDMACRNDIASFVAGLNERLSVERSWSENRPNLRMFRKNMSCIHMLSSLHIWDSHGVL